MVDKLIAQHYKKLLLDDKEDEIDYDSHGNY